jgi:hypothetical protein
MAAITVCKVIAYQFGIPWTNIAASSWKTALTGEGKSTKIKVRNTLLAMPEFSKVKDRHDILKKEQKEKGEKVKGIPLDVTDALGITLGYIREKQKNELKNNAPA